MRLAVAILLLFAGPPALKAEEPVPLSSSAARAFVDSVSHEYYAAKFALYPAYATGVGIRSHDSTLSDFRPREVRRFVITTRHLERALASIAEDSLDIQTWIDMKALRSEMATQLLFLEDLKMLQRSPMVYVDACTNGLYHLATRDTAFWLRPAFSSRLRKIPEVLGTARENLTSPMRLHCELAAAQARAFLPFLEGLSDTPLGDSESGAEALHKACRALEGFAAYLDTTALTADPQFALGRDNLTRLLEAQHMTELSPEDVLGYAERVLEHAKARLATLAPAPQAAPIDVDAAAALTGEEILGFYRAEADSAAAFLARKDIVDVSLTATLRVVPTPAFIRVLVPGYAYQPPGPFDDYQEGLLYVPLPEAVDLATKIDLMRAAKQRNFRGIIAHEIFPGHHLQIAAAARAGSFTRRLQQNGFTAEGWALYSEELMADRGYYGPDGERTMLRGVIYRAVRAIVDVKLQLGEFSLAQAADFVARETGRDRGLVEREVRQYAVDPTQPMSYLMGKKALLDVKDAYKRIRGRAYSEREFHDAVLGCGIVQPYLVSVCVTSMALGRQ